jgi:hypothetical protein
MIDIQPEIWRPRVKFAGITYRRATSTTKQREWNILVSSENSAFDPVR